MKRLLAALLILAAVFGMSCFAYAGTLFKQNEGVIDFSIADLVILDLTSSQVVPITTSTVPGLEVDNYTISLVWADNEVTPASIVFRVPDDYAGDLEFRLFVDESNSTTPNEVDFNVYVNRDGVTWDTSATNQTPVALDGTAGTPNEIILKPATDFDALQPGDVVTLNIWRDNTASGTGDLELYHLRAYYKKKLK